MTSGASGSAGRRGKIAIVGGIRPCGPGDEPPWSEEAGARAASEIGAALAKAGYDLIVYSSAEKFVERDVVGGYLSVEPVRAGSIHVRPPYVGPRIDFPHAPEHSDAFVVRHEAGTDWEIAYYRSLREAEGVVLLGGGRTTLITAMVATAFDIPIAPVAAFGGGARKAWVTLGRNANSATPEEISTFGAAWRTGSAESVVAALTGQGERHRSLESQRKSAQRRIAHRANAGLVLGALLLVAGLATIPLVYAGDGNASLTLIGLIAGSLLTATAGAISRTAVDRGDGWGRAAVLGMSAGAIAVLLFISAQLATSPDLLSGPDARRLLFFVLSVGFIAGFTFDAVYAKVRQQDALHGTGLQSVLPDGQEHSGDR